MKILNSTDFGNFAQNTMKAVAVETIIKAVGRPAFICVDKNTDKKTKKYAAPKECLYQLLCLGVYLLILPLFRFGGYNLAKQVFKKDPAVQALFEKCKIPFIKEGKTYKGCSRLLYEFKHADIITPEMQKLKGGVEAISIIGSMLGLAVLAPQISHVILHPIMKKLGIDKKTSEAPKVPLNKTV